MNELIHKTVYWNMNLVCKMPCVEAVLGAVSNQSLKVFGVIGDLQLMLVWSNS